MTTKNRTLSLQLTASNQDIYVVPVSFKASVGSIIITSISGSSCTFSLDWYKLSNTTYYPIATTMVMMPYSVLQITDALYLEAGDKLRGLASATSSIVITVKTSEQFSVSSV
jgi:hypothetical protein